MRFKHSLLYSAILFGLSQPTFASGIWGVATNFPKEDKASSEGYWGVATNFPKEDKASSEGYWGVATNFPDVEKLGGVNGNRNATSTTNERNGLSALEKVLKIRATSPKKCCTSF